MSRTTRCKLTLVGKSEPSNTDLPMVNLGFQAQYKPEKDPEDEIYGKYTPGANFNASIVATSAEHFEVGKSYYFDITEVPEAALPLDPPPAPVA